MLWALKLKARLYLQMEYQCWKTGAKSEAQKGPSFDLKKLVRVAMVSLVKSSPLQYQQNSVNRIQLIRITNCLISNRVSIRNKLSNSDIPSGSIMQFIKHYFVL